MLIERQKKLARTDANTDDVLIAKLATLAIRQLHASDVVCLSTEWCTQFR